MLRIIISALLLAFALISTASAQEKPALTIYTYDAFAADWGPGPELKAGFEKLCDCTLNFVATDSSIGALRRVQLEGEDTSADIVLGLDTSIVGEARATGLFVPHNVDTSALIVPNDWRADDFVPFDYGYFAMIYNKELMPEPPKSFEQVASRSRDIKIVIQDPRSSTPGLGLMLWIKAAYGNDAEEAWPEIAPRVVTLTRSWSESYALFLAGEADMVLSYTTSPAYHMIEENVARYAAAPFREGHYTQIEVAGILASSQQKDLANAFLTYLISEEAQSTIPTTNWMYPVVDVELPKEFGELFVPEKTLLLDDQTVTQNSAAWIAEMLKSFE